MARVNIYLPDDLATRAREAGLNVSRVAQAAIEDELKGRVLGDWLARVRARPPLAGSGITHEELMEIRDEVREELGRAADKHVDPERYQAEVDAVRTGDR
jgi:hypothetical protein